MESTISVNMIEELKEKLAGWLFNKQNHSCETVNSGFYVQAYLNQIWLSMDLDKTEKQFVETAYREMIIDGHINPEAVPSSEKEVENEDEQERESEIRLSLTDEGICYYIYAYE